MARREAELPVLVAPGNAVGAFANNERHHFTNSLATRDSHAEMRFQNESAVSSRRRVNSIEMALPACQPMSRTSSALLAHKLRRVDGGHRDLRPHSLRRVPGSYDNHHDPWRQIGSSRRRNRSKRGSSDRIQNFSFYAFPG